MEISEIVTPESVSIGLKAADKPELLSIMSAKAAPAAGVAAEIISRNLMQREAFGSTGIGRGVAIPHTAIKGLKRPIGLLARLDHSIDFDAVDGQPVDLVFLLLTPEGSANENVSALASISRRLRDQTVLDGLRTGKTPRDIYDRLMG